MKILLTALLFCILNGVTFAQSTTPVYDADGNLMNYSVSSLNSKIQLTLQPDKHTTSIQPFQEIPNDPLGTIAYLKGAKKVLLTTRVRKDSLSYYRYSIIENDSITLVDNRLLSKVNFVWIKGSSHPGYLTMDLGLPDISGKKITVKIHRLPEASKVTTLIIYNKPYAAAKLLDIKIISLSKKGKMSSIIIKNNASIDVDENMSQLYVSMKKTDLDFAYHVNVISTSPDGSNINIGTISNYWRYDSVNGQPYTLIDIRQLKKIGDYKIILAPFVDYTFIDISDVYSRLPVISFKIRSVPREFYRKDVLKISLSLIVLATSIATIIFVITKRRNRKRLDAVQKQEEAAKSELDQIRSQLNPHFVYNSLSGIQNLMNQNETEKANSYLNKFARLTRNILNDQELISIQDERNLLDDYLSMESLRFKFSYAINIIGEANFPNAEIPAMLLQPFVENSVKHNMATLQDKGELLIELKARQKDVVLLVRDNGKGFDTEKTYEGLGLKLCRKRIDLLNQLYKECPISMTIDSTSTGTTVTTTLENWL